jgi:hypothetical protein
MKEKNFPEYPDLGRYDDRWTMQDQCELDHLRIKYANIPAVDADSEPDWMMLRKAANKNEFLDDGKTKNPHYPRMKIEADMARLQYELAIMVRVNAIAFEQLQLQGMVFERMGILEGAYNYLRSKFDGVFNIYQDSMKKHMDDRREWHTQNAMRRAGLDPDSKEDRMKWARQLDDITAKAFSPQKKLEDQDRIDYAATTTTKEEQANVTTERSHRADGAKS